MNKLPLYSIELNRFNQNEFVVAGMDPYIRVFDRRYIDSHTEKPVKSFCPDLLVKSSHLNLQRIEMIFFLEKNRRSSKTTICNLCCI